MISLNDKQGRAVIPTLIDLSANKYFSYSMVYLKSQENFISLNTKLMLNEDITVLAYADDEKLLTVEGRNLLSGLTVITTCSEAPFPHPAGLTGVMV